MPGTSHARRTLPAAVASARLGALLPLLTGVLLALGAGVGDSMTSPTHLALAAAVGATGLAVAGALLVTVAAVALATLPRTGPAPGFHRRAPHPPSRQQDPTAAGRPHPRAPGATTLPRAVRTA